MPPAARPADFAVTLRFRAGSMPPPHHYRTRTELGADGSGTITTTIGYGSDGPTRDAAFALGDAEMDALHADLDALGLFETPWAEAPRERRAIGGALTAVEAVADGRSVEIPARVRGDQRDARDAIVERVRAAVPEATAAAVRSWRSETQAAPRR